MYSQCKSRKREWKRPAECGQDYTNSDCQSFSVYSIRANDLSPFLCKPTGHSDPHTPCQTHTNARTHSGAAPHKLLFNNRRWSGGAGRWWSVTLPCRTVTSESGRSAVPHHLPGCSSEPLCLLSSSSNADENTRFARRRLVKSAHGTSGLRHNLNFSLWPVHVTARRDSL